MHASAPGWQLVVMTSQAKMRAQPDQSRLNLIRLLPGLTQLGLSDNSADRNRGKTFRPTPERIMNTRAGAFDGQLTSARLRIGRSQSRCNAGFHTSSARAPSIERLHPNHALLLRNPPQQRQHLAAQIAVLRELATHRSREHERIRLLCAAHTHAHVLTLDQHCDAARVKMLD